MSTQSILDTLVVNTEHITDFDIWWNFIDSSGIHRDENKLRC